MNFTRDVGEKGGELSLPLSAIWSARFRANIRPVTHPPSIRARHFACKLYSWRVAKGGSSNLSRHHHQKHRAAAAMHRWRAFSPWWQFCVTVWIVRKCTRRSQCAHNAHVREWTKALMSPPLPRRNASESHGIVLECSNNTQSMDSALDCTVIVADINCLPLMTF